MTNWIEDTLYSNGVMKNKLHIHSQEELERKEYLISSRNALTLLCKKPVLTQISDLKKIHQIMFGELYDWAGKYRPGNFQKNGYEFFDHTRFSFAETDINNIIKQQPKGQGLQVEDYAQLIDAINFMHPFREGNGRSSKVFLLAYAGNHKQTINFPLENDQMIEAQGKADIPSIAKLIRVEDTPARAAAFRQLIRQQKNKRRKNEFRRN